MKRILYSFLGLIIAVSFVYADQTNVGKTSGNFLTIPVGAKALSLGSAYTAGADNVEGLYWNPGAISKSAYSQAEFYSANWLVDTKFNWVGVVLKISQSDAIGISFTHLDYGEEDVNTVDQQYGTGEKWEASDKTFGLTYARNLTDRFSIGGSMKYISQKIWHSTADAIAVDLGLLFITQFNDMRIAMSISNFGSDLRFDGKDLYRQIDLDPDHNGNNEAIVSKLKVNSYPLPLVFRTGLLINLFNVENYGLDVDLLTDAVRPNNNSEYINIGLQANIFKFVNMQAGYNSILEKDSEESFTFGMGMKYAVAGLGVVDAQYAMQTMDTFDNIHTFSLSVRF